MTMHVILVPGFAGFDVLGELHYYAGVTEQFRASPKFGPGRALDYFDNFPTASVAQRADRLRRFLAKKWARGELSPSDQVTLVGHSTGALDIRRLLCDLRLGFGDPISHTIPVDGLSGGVQAADLRRVIRRVVFLSAPHFGTSIGDYFFQVRAQIMLAARNAGQAVATNQKLPFSKNRASAVGEGSCQLFDAVADALRDSDTLADEPKRADEREALYNLLLWLEHVSNDVGALSDLRSYGSAGTDKQQSPAFHDERQRSDEIADYCDPAQPIALQCYATRVSQPPAPDFRARALLELLLRGGQLAGFTAPLLELLPHLPGASLASAPSSVAGAGGTWALFRNDPGALFALLHGICGAKKLAFPDLRSADAAYADAIAPGGTQPLLSDTGSVPFDTAQLKPSDNDGIVNTLSMLWPYAPTRPLDCSHYLIEADHADIIGHYAARAVSRVRLGGRENEAYDIFESGSKFNRSHFAAIWQQIMRFAL